MTVQEVKEKNLTPLKTTQCCYRVQKSLGFSSSTCRLNSILGRIASYMRLFVSRVSYGMKSFPTLWGSIG